MLKGQKYVDPLRSKARNGPPRGHTKKDPCGVLGVSFEEGFIRHRPPGPHPSDPPRPPLLGGRFGIDSTSIRLRFSDLTLFSWKATKEYLNQRGTKIRVFQVCFRTPFLPPFFPSFLPPLSPSGPVHFRTTPPLFTSPFIPPFLAPGKVRFRYPLYSLVSCRFSMPN